MYVTTSGCTFLHTTMNSSNVTTYLMNVTVIYKGRLALWMHYHDYLVLKGANKRARIRASGGALCTPKEPKAWEAVLINRKPKEPKAGKRKFPAGKAKKVQSAVAAQVKKSKK